jgi:hypothetical protein
MMVLDQGGEALLLAFAQLAGAPRPWKVIHMTTDRLLPQDGLHSALIAANPQLHNLISAPFFSSGQSPNVDAGRAHVYVLGPWQ